MICVYCKKEGTTEKPVTDRWFHFDAGDVHAPRIPCAYRNAPLCGACLEHLGANGR